MTIGDLIVRLLEISDKYNDDLEVDVLLETPDDQWVQYQFPCTDVAVDKNKNLVIITSERDLRK